MAAAEASDVKEEEDGSQTERQPPQALLLVLEKINLASMEETRIGDLHLVEPYSPECNHLVGFFLTWELVLRLCGHSTSELRYQYAAYLSNSGLISKLMDNLFCIIPHANQQTPVDLQLEFRPDFILTEGSIQVLATRVYSSALRYLPALVRRWCNNADKRTATFVERFTAR